ncbi:TonB-dependent receptor [Steroidobacter sp. S1-65]|uniref:TonB-dependent receptor n=1 Tax=Steroidobacter gossypii TaxID=2805490 RepID=A0ABS1X4V8_9GAMM|nr:TonB-dependent receptor [Steroidobacter gossypii]MBM0108258.1 TonB-dependent receptor [Steroidobacter gossypii]
MDTRTFLATAAILTAGAPVCVCAQGVATDKLIDAITVTGLRERAGGVEVPNTTASKTAEELRAQNLFNPEDALNYLPNITIRKRYIGDRNALIGGRSFSTLQPARGLVFMDGYLLSNFLGRFDAPRWNMIAPEEIERVDVLYGPYSATYPGNSIGTTVAIRTRRPDDFTMSVRSTAFSEHFDEYGLEEDYDGWQVSAFLGDRFDNGAWFTLAANRQDATGHPMQYYTVSANSAGAFPTVTGDATPVSGVRFDRDPQGRRRAVFGANSGAIDHTIQDQVKLRGGYAITDWLEAEGFIALWRNDTEQENRTFMRDAAGNEVWSGRVIADGITFNVPATAFLPSSRDEEHRQWGTTLRTTRGEGWNASLVYSRYDILEDSLIEGFLDVPADDETRALNSERDDTGWQTFEIQGVYTPVADDWLGGNHTLALGFHRNEYELANPVYDILNAQVPQFVYGKTRLQAWYLQDEWQLAEQWSLTLGVRYEDWEAFGGGQRIGADEVSYPERKDSAVSPKASLAYVPNSEWTLRLSVGRGVRFPTVPELFQGASRAGVIVVNDPNLQPERSDSVDFTVEHWLPWGKVRATLFQDDVRDSIFSQTNITVTPNVTNVQNVDRVRTRGIETAFSIALPGVEALTFDGSLAYARARILENDNFPVSVGKLWPRIPKWRGNLQTIWRPTEDWLASLGVRYSGRMFGQLDNSDINPDTYGGVSRFTMLDARVAYTTASNIELALGVDNLTDERAYQMHPYPGRTAFVEARWSFEGTP